MILRWIARVVGILTGTMLVVTTAIAGGGFQVHTYASYTDNLFQNYSKRTDWLSRTYLDFGIPVGRSMGFHYSGNANAFAEYDDLFTHQHEVGLSYYRSLGGRDAFDAGITGSIRLDRPVYSYYDAVEGEAFARLKRYLRPDLLARVHVRSRARHYYNAADFSYLENRALLQVSRFFQTKTTLQMTVEAGLKSYTEGAPVDSIEAATRSRLSGSQHLSQARLGLKAAQTLGPGLGLRIEYLAQVNLTGRNRYAQLETYSTDEELFDDAYSYDQQGLAAVLKKVWSGGSEVELAGSRSRRNYLGRPALDLNGFLIGENVTRSDTRWQISAGTARRFPVNGMVKSVTVEAEVLFRRTSSNDPYYDASGRTYSLGLSAAF